MYGCTLSHTWMYVLLCGCAITPRLSLMRTSSKSTKVEVFTILMHEHTLLQFGTRGCSMFHKCACQKSKNAWASLFIGIPYSKHIQPHVISVLDIHTCRRYAYKHTSLDVQVYIFFNQISKFIMGRTDVYGFIHRHTLYISLLFQPTYARDFSSLSCKWHLGNRFLTNLG